MNVSRITSCLQSLFAWLQRIQLHIFPYRIFGDTTTELSYNHKRLYSAPKYWIWYTSICMSGPHQKKHRENWRIHDFPEIMRNKGSNESFSLTSISFEMIRACLWNKHLLKCSSASSQMTAASIPFTYHVSSHIRALK